ncbi:MAG TPA: hypothetical protein VFQ53_19295 [Kofleriaceae bacterium]|nr:hypothetical protein [Kofleriaceae bacterium]
MQCCLWIGSPWLATIVFWLVFGACMDASIPDPPPMARVIAEWDPRTCGEPHRVALELEDDAGAMIATSVPCNLGSLTLDAPHFGWYRGRLYAWALDPPEGEPQIYAVRPVELAVDEPVVRWLVGTP